MKIGLWDELAAMEKRLEDLFRGFGGFGPRHTWLALPEGRPSVFVPTTDTFVRNGDLVIRVDLPGIDPGKDISVTREDGTLVVRGERRGEEEVKKEHYYRKETVYGSFERRVALPPETTDDDVEASYDAGVLEVKVHGGATPSPAKTIPVRTSQS